jgi:hypothetical protein
MHVLTQRIIEQACNGRAEVAPTALCLESIDPVERVDAVLPAPAHKVVSAQSSFAPLIFTTLAQRAISVFT